MADTARTRAALLALFADNVTGQISEQDFRDFVVTAMQAEFVNANDFWCGPAEYNLSTDKTTRGWHLYSQLISSTIANGVSFGNVYTKNASNVWSTADVTASTMNYHIGIPADSYDAGASNAKILVWGIVYNSAMSAKTASAVGYPLYLQSTGDANLLSVTITANSIRVVGKVLPSGQSQSTAVGSGKLFFDANWTIPVG